MIHSQLFVDPMLTETRTLYEDLKSKNWSKNLYYVLVFPKSPFQCECVNKWELERIDGLTSEYYIVAVLGSRAAFRGYSLMICRKVYIKHQLNSLKSYYLQGDYTSED